MNVPFLEFLASKLLRDDKFPYFQNLERVPVGNARGLLTDMFKFLNCLNPYSADVDYVIGLHEMIIDGKNTSF